MMQPSQTPARALLVQLRGSVLTTVGALGVAGLGGLAFASILVVKGGADSVGVAAFFTGTAAYRLASVVASGGCENAVMAAVMRVSGTDSSPGHRAASAVVALRAAAARARLWSIVTGVVGATVLLAGAMLDGSAVVVATGVGILLSPTIGYLRIVGRAAVSAVSPAFGATTEALIAQLLLLACLLLPIPADALAAALLVLQAVVMTVVAVALHLDLRRRAAGTELDQEEVATVSSMVRAEADDLLVINIFAGAAEQFDLVVVGLLMGPYATNVYNIAKRLAGPLSVLAYGVSTHYVPDLARAHHRQGPAAAASALRRLQPWLALVGVAASGTVAVVGVVVFAPGLGSLFVTTLSILLVGQVINVAFGPVGLLLQTTGDAAFIRRISVRIGVVYAVVTLVLVLTVGTVGAALAQTATNVARNIWWTARLRLRVGAK
jgi:O-antigen/teichoic acid export membrane protein